METKVKQDGLCSRESCTTLVQDGGFPLVLDYNIIKSKFLISERSYCSKSCVQLEVDGNTKMCRTATYHDLSILMEHVLQTHNGKRTRDWFTTRSEKQCSGSSCTAYLNIGSIHVICRKSASNRDSKQSPSKKKRHLSKSDNESFSISKSSILTCMPLSKYLS